MSTKCLQNLTINSLQGPHGTPATKTMLSVSMLHGLLKHIEITIKKLSKEYPINTKSLLTLGNEHLHSVLRLKTDTPTVLDCSRDFMKGVSECMKKQTLCGFHYFTSQKRKHYEAMSGFLKMEDLPRLKSPIAKKLKENELKVMLQSRERYGRGVRQRSVRADTTKYNAGTLPLNLYSVADDDTSHAPISFENQSTNDIISTENHDVEESSKKQSENVHVIEHEVGDVFTISFEDNIFMAVVKLKPESTSEFYEADLYEETDSLHFKYFEQRRVHVNSLFKLSETAFEVVNEANELEFRLDENTYSALKSMNETEQISVTEQIELLESEMSSLTAEHLETRRGRRVVPVRSNDYYYF